MFKGSGGAGTGGSAAGGEGGAGGTGGEGGRGGHGGVTHSMDIPCPIFSCSNPQIPGYWTFWSSEPPQLQRIALTGLPKEVSELKGAYEKLDEVLEDLRRANSENKQLKEKHVYVEKLERQLAEQSQSREREEVKLRVAQAELKAAEASVKAAEASVKEAEGGQTRTKLNDSIVEELTARLKDKGADIEMAATKIKLLEDENKRLNDQLKALKVKQTDTERRDATIAARSIQPSPEEKESKNHRDAIQERVNCETELETLKASLKKVEQDRQRRHNSLDSDNSIALDSQATAETQASTAPTEWTCDSCGFVRGWKLEGSDAPQTLNPVNNVG
ncbi:hypothetical protein GQ53DRAFT_753981 [Thozetella sp. PMI_491]|nr:hypothetical protein GQ53DRAFT_753981 [Thozetella sp. PMI_491]